MKKIRSKSDDLAEMLNEMKIGDSPIFDEVSSYEITKVPGGYIYKNEYCGLCFVPDAPSVARVGPIKVSVAKTEPKKVVKK
jgi:hypothetical protein